MTKRGCGHNPLQQCDECQLREAAETARFSASLSAQERRLARTSRKRICCYCSQQVRSLELQAWSMSKWCGPFLCGTCRKSERSIRPWALAWRASGIPCADVWRKTDEGKRFRDSHEVRVRRSVNSAKGRGHPWAVGQAEIAITLLERAGSDPICACCKAPESVHRAQTHIDHCHATGLVRDLLCARCNSLIGHADEDIGILKAAIRYLEKHRLRAVERAKIPPGGPLSEESTASLLAGLEDVRAGRVRPLDPAFLEKC